jgi:hypothetical protein
MAEGAQRQICPGEERCPKYVTAQDKERACRQCPKNVTREKMSDIEGAFAVYPWIAHLLWLFNLVEVGATFHLDDLSYLEWEGLLILKAAQAEVEKERYEKERVRHQNQEALAKSQSQIRR